MIPSICLLASGVCLGKIKDSKKKNMKWEHVVKDAEKLSEVL